MIVGDEELVVDRWKRYCTGLYAEAREKLKSSQVREILGEGVENIELEKMMKQLQKMKNGRSPCVFNI